MRDPVRVRCHDVSRGGGHHPAPPVGQVTRGRGRRRLGRIPTSAGVDGPDQPQRAGTCGLEPTPERTGGRTRRSSTPSKRRPTARLGLRHAHRVACSRPAGYRRPLRSTSVGFRPAAVGTRVITGDPQRAAVPVRRPERRARRPVGSRHRVRRQRVHRRFQWPGSEGRHGVQTRRVSVGCIRHRRGGAAHLVEGAALTAWSGCDGRWLAGIGLDRELTVRRSPFRRSGSGGSAGAGWLPVAIPTPITADCRLESGGGLRTHPPSGVGVPHARIQPQDSWGAEVRWVTIGDRRPRHDRGGRPEIVIVVPSSPGRQPTVGVSAVSIRRRRDPRGSCHWRWAVHRIQRRG